ncbi:MAG: hypothetical protein U0797_30850 [Gemmataceae bacterium]
MVVGYDEDIRGPLLDALRRLDPGQIGLNYSLDDVTADGEPTATGCSSSSY